MFPILLVGCDASSSIDANEAEEEMGGDNLPLLLLLLLLLLSIFVDVDEVNAP
jgi:hypothetical protein